MSYHCDCVIHVLAWHFSQAMCMIGSSASCRFTRKSGTPPRPLFDTHRWSHGLNRVTAYALPHYKRLRGRLRTRRTQTGRASGLGFSPANRTFLYGSAQWQMDHCPRAPWISQAHAVGDLSDFMVCVLWM